MTLRVVPVPAGLTSLVQPLDTHCFAAMKRRIRERYTQCRSAGDFHPHAFLSLMSDISSNFLCSVSWATAFEQVGIQDCPHSHLTGALQDYFPWRVTRWPLQLRMGVCATMRKWDSANFVLQVPKPGMDLSPEDVRCQAKAPKMVTCGSSC